MGLGFGIKRVGVGVVLAVGCGLSAVGQASIAVNVPETPLLPDNFGAWKKAAPAAAQGSGFSLATLSKAALEECGPQRSAVADYSTPDHGGEVTIHVEAIQFGDRSGAYSAFTLAERPGMKESKALGSLSAVAPGAVLFTVGSTLMLATGGSGNVFEVASFKPLVEVLPKVAGNKGVAPMLPSLLPEKGLVAGSVRYALGAETYQAEGGVLPAHSLGWEKSAEAVTAQYDDKRGKETLTMLLYPTPMIAGSFTKSIKDGLGQMGPGMVGAQVRREGELVLLASGSFTPEQTQHLLENIHLKQELSFDKDVQPVFHTEVAKTYSLLTSISVLAGVLMLAAVLLGLFLGGGRAAIRVLRGKPPATEIEFLSLHLSPQNKAPEIGKSKNP
jgi:hypothetical protein